MIGKRVPRRIEEGWIGVGAGIARVSNCESTAKPGRKSRRGKGLRCPVFLLKEGWWTERRAYLLYIAAKKSTNWQLIYCGN